MVKPITTKSVNKKPQSAEELLWNANRMVNTVNKVTGVNATPV
jgi:hypothetical protein